MESPLQRKLSSGKLHLSSRLKSLGQTLSHHHPSLPGQGHALPPRPPKPEKDEWGLTRAQREAKIDDLIQQLRTMMSTVRVRDPDNDVPPSSIAPLDSVTFDRRELLRFLRARDYSVSNAAKMYVEMVLWREEMSVDSIYRNFEFHERAAFFREYPQGYHGADREGRPIYISKPGMIDPKRVLKITTPERIVKAHIQSYEFLVREVMPACSRLAGHRVEQTSAIMDVKGLGLSQLTGEVKYVLQTTTSVTQNAYPETSGQMMIINAPLVFKIIFAFVKPLLSSRTLSKIHICGSDFQPLLLRYIAPDQLPVEYGGTSTHSILENWGPWVELLESEKRFPPTDPRFRAALIERERELEREEEEEKERQQTGLDRTSFPIVEEPEAAAPGLPSTVLRATPAAVVVAPSNYASPFESPPGGGGGGGCGGQKVDRGTTLFEWSKQQQPTAGRARPLEQLEPASPEGSVFRQPLLQRISGLEEKMVEDVRGQVQAGLLQPEAEAEAMRLLGPLLAAEKSSGLERGPLMTRVDRLENLMILLARSRPTSSTAPSRAESVTAAAAPAAIPGHVYSASKPPLSPGAHLRPASGTAVSPTAAGNLRDRGTFQLTDADRGGRPTPASLNLTALGLPRREDSSRHILAQRLHDQGTPRHRSGIGSGAADGSSSTVFAPAPEETFQQSWWETCWGCLSLGFCCGGRR